MLAKAEWHGEISRAQKPSTFNRGRGHPTIPLVPPVQLSAFFCLSFDQPHGEDGCIYYLLVNGRVSAQC